MFYTAKNVKLMLNGKTIPANSLRLSQEVGLQSPIKDGWTTSQDYLNASPFIGKLQFSYYLTGEDYLKQYIYTNQDYRLTGNFCGLTFNQGYISSLNLECNPNSPAIINCDISFFDKISGSFSPVSFGEQNYDILKLTDLTIYDTSGYTTNVLNNITNASFSYNCELTPSYKSYVSGVAPYQADNIFIGEKTISAEFTSDSTNVSLPLSGEKYGVNFVLGNSLSNESFEVSGLLNAKELKFSTDDVHSNVIKITQKHLSVHGEIAFAVTFGSSQPLMSIALTSHPVVSSDGFYNINRILIDEIPVTRIVVAGQTAIGDAINCIAPRNIVNGILRIETPTKTLVLSTPVVFNTLPQMLVSGFYPLSGRYGSPINISGTNLYQINRVDFNGIPATFRSVNESLIQAVVPYGGLVGKITLTSDRRSRTGISSGYFYCEPDITSISPVTGLWKDSISINGVNFSGTTGVQFNGVNAFAFTINSNTSITAQTPDTGQLYSFGNISILTSGGRVQSNSTYQPHVPIYSFDPTSGVFQTPINIRLKLDTGYCSVSGSGIRIRFGNVDTYFFPSGNENNVNVNARTGCITGLIPIGAIDDYIYLYRPDGVTTYSPYTGKFNVISEPKINSITPSIINQYKYFSPVILGENLKFFFGRPYFLAFSGKSDVQYYSNINSNSGTLADTAYINNIMLTGQTGLYNVIIQNFAGIDIFTGGLLLQSGINQASMCRISANTELSSSRSRSKYRKEFLIDQNTGSVAALPCTTSLSANAFTLSPPDNKIIDVSLIKILGTFGSIDNLTYNPSGVIALYQRNSVTPIYTTSQTYISGQIINLLPSTYTGIRVIKISTPKTLSNNTEYMGISDFQIY